MDANDLNDLNDLNDEDALDGTEIHLFWDIGVEYPLWNDGLRDGEWIRDVLGVSQPLLQRLAEWCERQNALDAGGESRISQEIIATLEDIHIQGRELAVDLQREVGPGLSIVYGP